MRTVMKRNKLRGEKMRLSPVHITEDEKSMLEELQARTKRMGTHEGETVYFIESESDIVRQAIRTLFRLTMSQGAH